MASSNPDRPDGRRARGAASRATILDAATELFSTHGYTGTTISAIAASTGLRPGSIYHAFGSKQGLLDAVMTSVADRAFGAVESITHDTESAVGPRLQQTARTLVGDPVFLRLFLLLALEKVDDEQVRSIVESVRSRARAAVTTALAPLLDDLPTDLRPVAAEATGRIALILLDGVFVSHQLDSEHADLDQTLALVTVMAELALGQLPTMLGRPDQSSPGGHE